MADPIKKSDLNPQAQNAVKQQNAFTLDELGSGAGVNPGNLTPENSKLLSAWVGSNFGSEAAQWVHQFPSVANIFFQARSKGLSRDVIEAYLRNDPFIQQIIREQQPASKGGGGGRGGGGGGGMSAADQANQIDSIKAMLGDQASTLGIPLSEEQKIWIATYGINHSYTQIQYTDSLMGLLNDVVKPIQGGTISVDRDKIRALGLAYMTQLSDQTIDDYAQRIARGELDEDGVGSIVREQAKARFQYLAPMIDAGVTVQDFFAPVRDAVARTLEMAPEQINLMDPQWMKLVELPGADGKPRAATTTEAVQFARARPEWAKTNNARDLAASWAVSLPKAFGRN